MWRQLFGLPATTAHENIEHVFDPGQILANRRGHRVHQLDGRRREVFAFLLDGFVHRQQFGEAERGAHRRDAWPGRSGAGDVIEQIVQQLDWRVLRIARLTEFIESADFAISQAQQPLDRDVVLDAVFAQRFEQRSAHPPQLEYALLRSHLLEACRHGGQDLKILLEPLAAYPTHETGLKA